MIAELFYVLQRLTPSPISIEIVAVVERRDRILLITELVGGKKVCRVRKTDVGIEACSQLEPIDNGDGGVQASQHPPACNVVGGEIGETNRVRRSKLLGAAVRDVSAPVSAIEIPHWNMGR